ncbi:MAG: hypothetical protein A2Z75_07560 [Chloroflexi bacterium RBG_13_50_10]|nr:MAG: hypothetical protein A2Z75_07560 [Chloroflexi bacterium RBG_13_50_10]
MQFFVYILLNPDNRFYIGQTSDLQLRLQRHNEGKVISTKSRRPWKLVYSEQFDTRSEAISRERQLKRLKSKKALQALVAQ